MSQRHVLVAVAWPYASGSRHLGHLAGAYLPADIFARYHRMIGSKVLMVSGSDVHGTPITVRADQEGVTPQEIVDRYHNEFLANWRDVGISWDLYTSTGTANHHSVTQDVFLTLAENGFITTKTSEQLYDVEVDRFLPDRYVEGTCPYCEYPEARGDQCDNCGRQLDPTDLITPRSRMSGSTPELRATEHYYLLLSKFQDRLLDWLKGRQGWRKHVLNMAIGFTEEGLQDRAITRDLEWGVAIPDPYNTIGDGKRIYVWFDAVIGYLSASKQWALESGRPEAWKDWWHDDQAESYYFIGKDNIVFHAVIWPCQLMGYEGLNLPTDVPANQFITFLGEQASASRGVGRPIGWYTERLEPDALRYALSVTLPEQNDSDLSEEQMIERINAELVATWGNLVNRVMAMTNKNFNATIPDPGQLDDEDTTLLESIDAALVKAGEEIGRVELRAGLRTMMAAAAEVNAYLNTKAPWATAKTDLVRTATTLYMALSAINGIKVGLAPYLPFTTQTLHEMLGYEGPLAEVGWSRIDLVPGTQLSKIGPLYSKVDSLGE